MVYPKPTTGDEEDAVTADIRRIRKNVHDEEAVKAKIRQIRKDVLHEEKKKWPKIGRVTDNFITDFSGWRRLKKEESTPYFDTAPCHRCRAPEPDKKLEADNIELGKISYQDTMSTCRSNCIKDKMLAEMEKAYREIAEKKAEELAERQRCQPCDPCADPGYVQDGEVPFWPFRDIPAPPPEEEKDIPLPTLVYRSDKDAVTQKIRPCTTSEDPECQVIDGVHPALAYRAFKTYQEPEMLAWPKQTKRKPKY